MQISDLPKLLDHLRALPAETEWAEFKQSYFEPKEIGERISAIANSAMLEHQACGFIVFGIADGTHEVVGTTVRLKGEKVGGEDFEHWISRMLEPKITLSFKTTLYQDQHVELIVIDPAYQRPVRFQNNAYIRIGSITKRLVNYPQREATLWQLTAKYHFEDSIAAYHLSKADIIHDFFCSEFCKQFYGESLLPDALINKLVMGDFRRLAT